MKSILLFFVILQSLNTFAADEVTDAQAKAVGASAKTITESLFEKMGPIQIGVDLVLDSASKKVAGLEKLSTEFSFKLTDTLGIPLSDENSEMSLTLGEKDILVKATLDLKDDGRVTAKLKFEKDGLPTSLKLSYKTPGIPPISIDIQEITGEGDGLTNEFDKLSVKTNLKATKDSAVKDAPSDKKARIQLKAFEVLQFDFDIDFKTGEINKYRVTAKSKAE